MTHDHHHIEPTDRDAEDCPAAAMGQPTEAAELPPRETLRRQPPAPAGAAKLQPGWVLSASGEHLTREEILARYRRQRGLPEDPFENGARPVPPPGYRERIMNDARPAYFAERRHPETVAAPVRTPRTFTAGQTFAISAIMALVAGGCAGVMSAKLPGLSTSTSGTGLARTSAVAVPAVETPQPVPTERLQVAQTPARDTVIEKKPIATATLQVADVSGATNSFIPLVLHAEPVGPATDMLLKISGIPEGAYLTSGRRQDDQVWALSLADIRNVKLVVPQTDDPQIDLAVAAFEPDSGELAAPVKTMTVALTDVVVQPASAPPPAPAAAPVTPAAKSALPGANATMPVAIPPPQSVKLALAAPESAETQRLIDAADRLLGQGDVDGARRSYARAWGNDGSAAAAFGMARSYDPLVLASLADNGGKPDGAEALRWYQRAASAGDPEATKAIIRLQMAP